MDDRAGGNTLAVVSGFGREQATVDSAGEDCFMKNRRSVAKDQGMLCVTVIFIAALLGIALVLMLFGVIRTQAAPAEPSYKYYTSIQVQSGDTLWGIADTYMTEEYTGVSAYIDEICSINHITADDIHAGQYLTIPYYSDVYLQ